MPFHPEKSNWFRIYLALVVLNIVVIGGGVYLSRSIKYNYSQSVEDNHRWVDRLSRYAELTRLAGSVNAPGNDVFDSGSIDTEIALRDSALAAFSMGMEEARAELTANVGPAEAGPLIAWLDISLVVMDQMIAQSNLIFENLRRGDTREAAAQMAAMDRQYAQLAGSMAALSRQVGRLQTHEFEEQIEAIQQLERIELLVGGLLVLMVTGMTFYGYKIVRKLYADEVRLARYSASLAEARDAANASNKAKSDFLAFMSHEIRTPLTTVLGMADLIAAGDLPEESRQHAQAIQSSGRHLLEIVNDVLDLSRIEADALALDRTNFQLGAVLEHVEWLMVPAADQRGISLDFDVRVDRGTVLRGDPTRLRQILLNLVGNAVKFTSEGGVLVEVTASPAGDALRLQVAVVDTGIGISEECQASLFQPFRQAGQETTRLYGGTGLGLAICRRLTEAMGGSIGLVSKLGQGSRFWFEIPFELGDRNAVRDELAMGPAPTHGTPLRILIVDDAVLNRQLLASVLARHGHLVMEAVDGAQAVEFARSQPYDVILMDVQMPVLDGIAATGLLRRLPPPARDIPVIGLSAGMHEEERRRCFAGGMQRCLSKPFVWNELFTAIAQVTAPTEPSPVLAPDTASRPLFDRFAVSLTADVEAAALMQQVIEDAERSCNRLRAALPHTEEVQQEAHKLKGISGMFGLPRILHAAERLQAAAQSGQSVAGMIDGLVLAVAATREELHGSGLIGATPPPANTDEAPDEQPQPLVHAGGG